MPNVMAALPNIDGAFCESSVIPFLVPRSKVWLTAAAVVPRSNAANIYRRTQDLDIKPILHRAKFCQGARAPENVYIVYQPRRRPNIVQFGWPLVSDVAAVTKARRETR